MTIKQNINNNIDHITQSNIYYTNNNQQQGNKCTRNNNRK